MNLLPAATVLSLILPFLTGCRSATDALAGELIVATVKAISGDPVISIHYSHSRRLQNRDIVLEIDWFHKLTLTTKAAQGKPVRAERTIPEDDFTELLEAVSSLNWEKAALDQMHGKDGTNVRITCNGRTLALWSPDYDARRRGLRKVVKLVETSFRLAGLDEEGMPTDSVSTRPYSFPTPGFNAVGLPRPQKH